MSYGVILKSFETISSILTQNRVTKILKQNDFGWILSDLCNSIKKYWPKIPCNGHFRIDINTKII